MELELEAPPECPRKDSIEQTLARLVQSPPATPLHVKARLTRDAQRWVLIAMLEGGQRIVGSDSCVAAAEALVVIMALAIDPANPVNPAALQDFEQANAPPAQPTYPPLSVVPTTAPPVPAAVSPRRVGGGWRLMQDQAQTRVSTPPWHPPRADRWGLSVLFLGEWGALPELSFGPAAFVRYGSPLRYGEISVSALWPKFKSENNSTARGARMGLVASQLAGCAAPGEGWPVAGCLGLELGDLFGRGDGVDMPKTGHGFWAALAAGAVYRGEFGDDFGLELRLGVAVPVVYPEFDVVNNGPSFFRPRAVSIRGSLGVSWR